jgi:heme/copper-type cytochrome/quinol oxidase subunit 2
LLFAIILSLALQHFVAPNVDYDKLSYAWSCDDLDEGFQESCRGVLSVLRVSFATTIFFLMNAIIAAATPSYNKNFWGIKILVYLLMVASTMFIPSYVFDDHGYLHISRVGGCIFIILQQIILIDLAYNWNDKWVENADADDKEEPGKGDVWLKALLAVSAAGFLAAYISLGFLFHYFNGCSSNSAFLWLTLLLTLIATFVQLSGAEGSLLTSSVMTMYAVYLCYAAVSNNPDDSCNPMLGENNTLDIVVGLVFIVLSMAWSAFSYSASITDMMTNRESGSKKLIDPESQKEEEAKVTGVVTGGDKYGATEGDSEKKPASGGEEFDKVRNSVGGDYDGGQAWKLNIVLAMLAMWYACVLTSWGNIKEGGEAANPSAGKVSMWMMAVSQWLALLLYIWTLMAPRLFPDRDFS